MGLSAVDVLFGAFAAVIILVILLMAMLKAQQAQNAFLYIDAEIQTQNTNIDLSLVDISYRVRKITPDWNRRFRPEVTSQEALHGLSPSPAITSLATYSTHPRTQNNRRNAFASLLLEKIPPGRYLVDIECASNLPAGVDDNEAFTFIVRWHHPGKANALGPQESTLSGETLKDCRDPLHQLTELHVRF